MIIRRRAPSPGDQRRTITALPPPRAPWWVRRRRLLLVLAVSLCLLALVAAAGTWLALGVRDSLRTGRAQASAAEREFDAFQATQSDRTAAVGHLDAVALHLTSARAAAYTPQIRLVEVLPWAKIPVSDLHHLLNAADDLLFAQRLALDVEAAFVPTPGATTPAPTTAPTSSAAPFGSGPLPGTGPLPGLGNLVRSTPAPSAPGPSTPQPLYANDTVSLPVLADVTAKAEQAAALTRDAERELLAVDGTGVAEQQVRALRDRGLEQVRDARRRLEPIVPVLRLLPPVLGSRGPRTYLLAVLDQASMRPSGGAPLAVATLTLDQARVTLGTAQPVASLTWPKVKGSEPSARLRWTPVAGDPFTAAASRAGLPFVDAGANPDFRVAGESLARAWAAGTGQHIDGVLTLDVSALRELLRVTGPVPVPAAATVPAAAASGQVDASNVAQLLLADLRVASDGPQRQAVGGALLGAVASRLTSGGSPAAKLQALLAAAPGRHVQLWAADDAVERFAESNGFAGAVATPPSGDHLAVYAQDVNAAEVDAFQQRTVDEVVRLAEDGSAEVTRTVTQRNTASGATSAAARTELVTLLPAGAEVRKAPAKTRHLGDRSGFASAVSDRTRDAAGRLVVRQTVQVPPGGVVTWSVTFRVPHLATPEGTGLSLPLLLEPSPTLDPTPTRTVVLPPAGWRVGPASGVQVVSGQGVVDAALDRRRSLLVSLAKG